jgi:hypothetical protein
VRRVVVTLTLAALVAPRLAAQAPEVAARLTGRVPPEVVSAVAGIAASASERGLPVEPLVQKAIEGGAKGKPADRVIAAVRTLSDQLAAAADALRSAGERADADVVEGGAYALGAGLGVKQVQELARASHPPYDAALTLRVAATLAALGVPPQNTVDLLLGVMGAGRSPNDLLDLPGEVEEGVAKGATPAQAAQGLGRAAAHAPPGRTGGPPVVPPGQQRPPNPHKP